MTNSLNYVPGTCNIGREEIKARKKVAVFSMLFAIALIVVLILVHADKLWRLCLFFPVTSLAIGIQQVYFKFCVGFGMKGYFNFSELGKMDSITEAEFRKKDRAKATQMIAAGISAALVAAVVFYFLPF